MLGEYCKKIKERYSDWEDSLSKARQTKDLLIEHGQTENQRELEKAMNKLQKARGSFYEKLHEQTSHELPVFHYDKITRIDKAVLEKANQLCNGSALDVLELDEENFVHNVRMNRDVLDHVDQESVYEALELMQYLSRLHFLFVTGINLKSIPSTLTQIKVLNCSDCGNMDLPPELTQLEEFECVRSEITSLPETWTNLKGLNCPNSSLEYIPNTYKNLESITMSNCDNLTEIPQGLESLKVLQVSGSNLEDLPKPLPSSLSIINIENTPAAEKPEVQEQLKQYGLNNLNAVIKY